MMITRFLMLIQEFFNRRLICWRRGGHDYIEVKRKILKKSDSYRTVAEIFIATRLVCETCGHNRKGFSNLEYHDYLTGLEMPDSWWDELKERGFLYWDR